MDIPHLAPTHTYFGMYYCLSLCKDWLMQLRNGQSYNGKFQCILDVNLASLDVNLENSYILSFHESKIADLQVWHIQCLALALQANPDSIMDFTSVHPINS